MLGVDVLSICEVLEQKGYLPEETPKDLLQGLSNASHERFRKVFADFCADLDNSMNDAKLVGTTLEKVTMILKTAVVMYTLFSLCTGDNA